MKNSEQKIQVWCGDITTLKVDAIVNAANNALLGGGGVDGAIHRTAGNELVKFCRQLNGCETGDAKMTPAFNLPSKLVIHTVGSVWSGGENDEADLLASCYQKVMKIAADEALTSIAFPAISCGVYAYPADEAVAIAVKEVKKALEAMPYMKRVVFCCFDSTMENIYLAEI